MTDRRPNVLFLSFDALRADRTSVCGYGRPTTPTLERLAADAILCTNAVAPCAFTQPSFASFFTSSPPLSHGGYDMGAAGRPRHLFRAFRDAGYETTLIATFPWVSRFYGYRDGIDRECLLFVLNALVGVAANTMKNSILGYHDGTLSRAEALDLIEPIVNKFFDDVGEYCAARISEAKMDRVDLARERLILNGYDFTRVRGIVEQHRRDFLADPAGYVERHFTRVPAAHEWIAADWRLARRPGALLANSLRRVLSRMIGLVRPGTAEMREYRVKRYIDAYALADRVMRMIETRDRSRPFFLWTHFVDTHVPYCAGRAPDWYRQTPGYLRALGYPETLDPAVAVAGKPRTREGWETWSALYDCTVRYVDEQIDRIVARLDEAGLGEETWVVICGDHGEELGEHGDISHHFRLYDHNLRVPLLFRRRGHGAKTVDGMTTLLDLAPTLMEMAGEEPDPDWTGQPVLSPAVAARDHVLFETFHGGNCLFDHRPVYMAVRTARWKYLWKEYVDPTDRYSPREHELYDIAADPLERNNLYRADHPAVGEFNRLIQARMAEIPEIGPRRAAAAFAGGAKRDAAE